MSRFDDEPALQEGRQRFRLTFGQRGLRDGYVVVDAFSAKQAKGWVVDEYGTAWSDLYADEDWQDITPEDRARYWPRGMHGRVLV